jgi:hypothetical protein
VKPKTKFIYLPDVPGKQVLVFKETTMNANANASTSTSLSPKLGDTYQIKSTGRYHYDGPRKGSPVDYELTVEVGEHHDDQDPEFWGFFILKDGKRSGYLGFAIEPLFVGDRISKSSNSHCVLLIDDFGRITEIIKIQ